MADVKTLQTLSLEDQVNLLNQLNNDQLKKLIHSLPKGVLEIEVGDTGWTMEIATIMAVASQKGIANETEANVPLDKIDQIKKMMESGESGGTTGPRKKLAEQFAKWNKNVVKNQPKNVGDLPVAEIVEKPVEEKVEVKPEPKPESEATTSRRPNIIRSERNSEQVETENITPKYVPGKGLEVIPKTAEARKMVRAQEKIDQRAAGYGVGERNLGYAAADSAKEFIAGVFGQIRRRDYEETGGSTEPENFTQRVTRIFRPTSSREVIETKREILEQQETQETQEQFVPPAKPQVQSSKPSNFIPQSQPRPRSQLQPREVYVRREMGGGGSRFLSQVRTAPRFFIEGIKNRILEAFGKKTVVTTGTAVAQKAVAGQAAKGLLSKIVVGIGSKLGGPISLAIFWGAQKIKNGLSAIVSGIFGDGDPIAAAGATMVFLVGIFMSLGTGIIAAAGIIVFSAIVFPMITSLMSTTAVVGSFAVFNGNNSRVAAGLPAPAVTVTKTSNLASNGNINYSASLNALTNVSNVKVTETVKVIDKSGTRIIVQKDLPYSSSINYTLQNPGVTDAIVVDIITVTGVSNGTAFTTSTSSETIIGNPPVVVFSCPVVGGKILLGSETATGGHCGPNYSLNQACPGGSDPWPGNEKAIDVAGSVNQSVYFPAIDGKQVSWQLVREGNDLNYSFNGASQKYREFKAVGVDYALQVHHLIDDGFLAGKTTFNSGEVLGKLAGFDGNVSSPHAHIQLQRAGAWTAADNPTLKFCQQKPPAFGG